MNTSESTGIDLSLRETAAMVMIRVGGEIDLATTPALRRLLGAVRDNVGPERAMVIDLRKVRFFSSSGIAELITARTHCRKQGAELIIIADNSVVLRPMQVTGLTTIFDIRAYVETRR
ncbi:anti-sigma factor antagonist [Pseudonocardiaceae bacterium YIM PH 21723]|nr:anti-sigma factor antagonist [Pseudonocardiaceae bacterium YIM PH 21723]